MQPEMFPLFIPANSSSRSVTPGMSRPKDGSTLDVTYWNEEVSNSLTWFTFRGLAAGELSKFVKII